MKFIFFISLLLILPSCSSVQTSKQVAGQADLIKDDPLLVKTNCEQNRHALSCARYAYRFKKNDVDTYFKYTLLACELGDQSSCFNLGQLKGKTFDYNMNVLKREETQIFSCYSYYSDDIQSSSVKIGEKEQKVLNISALINQEGKLQRVTLDGRNLNEKMEKCVQGIYSNKKFVGADKDMLLSLTLLMPIKYKEKDIAKNSLDGLADSLKDLN